MPLMPSKVLASDRVLVVDDEIDMRELLDLKLEMEAVSHDSVSNGREALDRLAREEYGCVLLDLMMPVVDGFGVLRAIRESRPDFLRRVIVVTGGSTELASRVDPGVFRVVRKPVALRDLMRVVRACLRQGSDVRATGTQRDRT